jgi:bifunctional DNA-binding transcriptional regulator/antitoxin component of YhaV-PrlF toxin-antitoxin module
MRYKSVVEYDDMSGEYILPIPDELLDSLGWVEGDTLKWEYGEDESILLSKTND